MKRDAGPAIYAAARIAFADTPSAVIYTRRADVRFGTFVYVEEHYGREVIRSRVFVGDEDFARGLVDGLARRLRRHHGFQMGARRLAAAYTRMGRTIAETRGALEALAREAGKRPESLPPRLGSPAVSR